MGSVASPLDAPLRDVHPALEGFHLPTQAWFSHSFPEPTKAQQLGWPLIRAGQSSVILAPTGSGKTLAAFLASIDRLMFAPPPAKEERCRVLYISPLKALAVDVERNLRAPLIGVGRYAERMGERYHALEVAIRTGDTPASERAAFNRHPADILITTPESLYLLLTSNAREALRSVRSVIVDEIHTMVGTKRGAHLALSLERLEALIAGAGGPPLQRIGLSATVRPIDEAARFLGGYWGASGEACGSVGVWEYGSAVVSSQLSADSSDPAFPGDALDLPEEQSQPAASASHTPTLPHPHTPPGDQSDVRPQATAPLEPRPVAIVDAGRAKQLDLTVEVPVEDMAKIGQVIEIPSGPAAQGVVRTSIWPAIYPMILELIRSHRSTLVFVNSRRLAERSANALNELAGEEIARAHHGSIAREQRLQIEDELKAGKLPAMVATSSLELGIDMGAIDLVVQVEAPPTVASGIQRIGRAGHSIGVPSQGIIIPKFRGDLLACAALTARMCEGAVEPLHYPRNPLDVLAQQIVGMVAVADWKLEELERVVRGAAPFAELPRTMLEDVLDMLSGRYPSDDFAELRPRLTWDRLAGTLRAREGSRRVAVSNSGTIPDRGLYGVFLLGAEKGKGRVGELDEEMVFESRVGETFVLGASTWRIEQITHDRVVVSPAPGEPGKMPFWKGPNAGRPLEFGKAIGALARQLREAPPAESLRVLQERHALSEGAARNLLQYLDDQQEAAGAVPDDRTIVVERYMDDMGDWRVCILSPFGSRVHAPWALAIEAMVREQSDLDVELMWTDDGIVVRFPEADEPPPVDAVIPDPDEVEDLVVRQLGGSAFFAAQFREAAGRALLLPRKYPGQRAPLWQTRKRAADLMKAASRYGSFPIILETYRECLRDVFDIPALAGLLRDIRRREVRTVPVTSRTPSPFAASLLFNYVANFIYDEDTPLAERRAQALSVDPSRLRELLGEVELRDLLDGDALEELELQLQFLTPDRWVKHPDGLHDLLIRLGDLSAEEIRARCVPEADGGDPEGWTKELERARRIIPLVIGGERRFIAAEDMGRYRDAVGIPPPAGLPAAFLESVRDPVGDLVARYARTHGPFHLESVAGRLGTGVAPVLAALNQLAGAGRVVEGEFRPGGFGQEWCDSGVLRIVRQKSLARLRKEVEPVEAPALGRLYLAWQGITKQRRGPEALLEVLEQLQGAALPASVLETQVLPARLEDYDPRDLDQLTASGAVIWVGCESLGQQDGRVSLYLAEHAPFLLVPPKPFEAAPPLLRSGKKPARDDLHDRIRETLGARGAMFFPQLLQACGGGFRQEVLDALWDLVWAGEVTNDTLQPLRAYLNPRRARPSRRGYNPLGLRSRALFPPESSGRWALVSSFLFAEPSPTERLTARTRQLLERHGVLTREAVHSEGIEGGFSALYPVLRTMEEGGHLRRGYFVAGRGATQFALPGAVDRLRTLREPEEEPTGTVLAATDPGNPYGAALPWPERAEAADNRRASRSAGAIVVLVDGALAGWMGRGERHMLTFSLDPSLDRDPEEVHAALARALADQVRPRGKRALFVKEVDGRPAQETPLAAALIEAGFTFGPHGYMKRL